jgi:hypothetical protein
MKKKAVTRVAYSGISAGSLTRSEARDQYMRVQYRSIIQAPIVTSAKYLSLSEKEKAHPMTVKLKKKPSHKRITAGISTHTLVYKR